MSILNFQKPEKILLQKATDFEGTFEFKPLEPGFGQTVGNSLRRSFYPRWKATPLVLYASAGWITNSPPCVG